MEPNRPFRWDLLRGDHLGTLLDDASPPDLWFADELLRCAAKVVARSKDGDLHFVGRSVDSLYDLLSGCLAGTAGASRLHPLPWSHRWTQHLDRDQVLQMRANLEADGVSPQQLTRRTRPVVFVDLVSSGGTFGELFAFLRAWIDQEGAQWDVIRTKLRFLGITRRTHTSPKTWRWQQHQAWTAELPPSAVVNVSLAPRAYRYFADEQGKVTVSFRPHRWLDESVTAPPRGRRELAAMAEALALFEHGNESRDELARLMSQEPAFAEPWLRTLALELRR